MVFEQRRLERLQIIKRSIDKAKNPDIEKLIAECCMAWGCSRRTALEYVKLVQTSLS